MKQIICAFLLGVFTFNSFALSKIDSAIEDSESKEKVEKPKKDDSSHHDDDRHSRRRHDDDHHRYSSYEEDDDDTSFAAAVFQLICLGWAMNQMDTKYSPYPYSNGNHYIVNSFTGKNYPARWVAMNIDTQALAFDSLGMGDETRFECMLSPFVRMYAGNTILHDGDETSGFFRIGGSIPFIQFNTISVFMDLGYMRWYGDSSTDLTDGDFMYGFVFKSTPFDPLIIETKFLIQNVTNKTRFYETAIHLGFLVYKNVELFGEFKRYSVDHDYGEKTTEIDGWIGGGLGIRAYF